MQYIGHVFCTEVLLLKQFLTLQIHKGPSYVAQVSLFLYVTTEDVDPSVGRFRNMIQTSFIPSSKVRLDRTTFKPISVFTSAVYC